MNFSRPKTAEELNLELYHKVCDELEKYKENLLSMPPEKILEHAYDYTIREDIVLALEYHELHARQAEALLKSDNALDEIFSKWESLDTDHMDHIRDAIEGKADEISRDQYLKGHREKQARDREER